MHLDTQFLDQMERRIPAEACYTPAEVAVGLPVFPGEVLGIPVEAAEAQYLPVVPPNSSEHGLPGRHPAAVKY